MSGRRSVLSTKISRTVEDAHSLLSRELPKLGSILRDAAGHRESVEVKGVDRDFATSWDRSAEKFIVELLGSHFKGLGFLGEERGPSSSLLDSGTYWIVDALDGTTNHRVGFSECAITVALACEGRVIYGVTWDIGRSILYHARRGCGVFRDGKQLGQIPARDPLDELIAVGSSRNPRVANDINTIVGRLRGRVGGIRQLGCASLDLVRVVQSTVVCFMHPDLKIWDRAAGELMVEEAGGVVLDLPEIQGVQPSDAYAQSRSLIAGRLEAVSEIRGYLREILEIQA